MLDGRPFFGSPTKLFEYMAVAKGIVASRLDQIAAVLEDHTSALLITPGSADELVCAMRQLAADSSLRERLGRRARERVMANFTWAQNAGRVLQRLRPEFEFEQCSDKDASPSLHLNSPRRVDAGVPRQWLPPN
jgi:glycosyltransferase involved in cell wall biosynthesis